MCDITAVAGSGGQWPDVRDPLTSATTRDRLALVTVMIKGMPYVIVDIGMRMLTPRELYNLSGFPADYRIERGLDGRVFSKAKQVRMCGNAVPPLPMAALIRANYYPRKVPNPGRRSEVANGPIHELAKAA